MPHRVFLLAVWLQVCRSSDWKATMQYYETPGGSVKLSGLSHTCSLCASTWYSSHHVSDMLLTDNHSDLCNYIFIQLYTVRFRSVCSCSHLLFHIHFGLQIIINLCWFVVKYMQQMFVNNAFNVMLTNLVMDCVCNYLTVVTRFL